MYWFGESLNHDFDWKNSSAWNPLLIKKRELSLTKISDIINLLDDFSNESFDDSLEKLVLESGFSFDETKKTLALLPGLLKKESLEKRVKAEFIKMDILDEFVKLPNSSCKVKAVPRGIVLHVTAGNVFLSSIDSLIMSLLTKNLSIIKVSSQNQFFPLYFAEKLRSFDKKNILSDKFAVLHWKGGDRETEDFIQSKVNAIVAWGGEEMIASYMHNLPLHVKFLDFGPKISIQVITNEGINNTDLSIVSQKIVDDIIPWDQSACASPQNLYLQSGVNETELLVKLEEAFLKAPSKGPIDEDEATEILKEKYRGYYSELMEEGKVLSGIDHLIHLEKDNILRPSPLHRSIIVKRFLDFENLLSILEPFSYYLQSCSYLFSDKEKNDGIEILALSGIKRFAPLGTITWGMDGAPHDGRFVLRELVNFVGDELRAQNYGETVHFTSNAETLKNHFNRTLHPPGYIFSSGGTTGEPKYLHFSYEEFDFMSDMLAHNLRAQGVKAGMTVANLFVAGNLWSSFLCVEKALEKIGAIQLPIGGMCSNDNILLYLKKFNPQIIMGIPSMLVMNAEYCNLVGEKLDIPMVFYAGEALSEIRREYLQKSWGTEFFGSAGYASVDAGVIGYQCKLCGPGEHHLFSDLIHMSIIEDEAVVSSIARSSMPIKNYRTGDRVEWISDCACGSLDKRFKLLGRIDNIIQIWSCRLQVADVESLLSEFGVATFQIKILEIREANLVREKFVLTVEESALKFETEDLIEGIYLRSRDVRDTIKYSDFKKDIDVIYVLRGEIPRNPRTGKVSLVIDQRH